MRINAYSDEITDRVELVEKTTEAGHFVGIRFFIYTPVTLKREVADAKFKTIHRGPFEKVDGDDDSSAVTFWCRAEYPGDLHSAFAKALSLLETHSAKEGD